MKYKKIVAIRDEDRMESTRMHFLCTCNGVKRLLKKKKIVCIRLH